MPGKTALIIGATGTVGQPLLRELLTSSSFDRVCEVGRRVTPLANLVRKEKLEQRMIDFEKIEQTKLDDGWDVVFITYVLINCSARGGERDLM